jgi:predicted O-methyltransferase YrrM
MWRYMDTNVAEDMVHRVEPLHVLPKGSIGAELGVQFGHHAEQLLNIVKPLGMLLVDIWPKDSHFEQITARFGDRENVTILRNSTLEVAAELKNESLDWVFVDANHEFDAVLDDGRAWYPKVKYGGYMIWHDWEIRGTREAIELVVMDTDLQFIAWARDRQRTVITKKIRPEEWGVVD